MIIFILAIILVQLIIVVFFFRGQNKAQESLKNNPCASDYSVWIKRLSKNVRKSEIYSAINQWYSLKFNQRMDPQLGVNLMNDEDAQGPIQKINFIYRVNTFNKNTAKLEKIRKKIFNIENGIKDTTDDSQNTE